MSVAVAISGCAVEEIDGYIKKHYRKQILIVFIFNFIYFLPFNFLIYSNLSFIFFSEPSLDGA